VHTLFGLNLFSEKRSNIQDLPAPESPIKSILHRSSESPGTLDKLIIVSCIRNYDDRLTRYERIICFECTSVRVS